jgi:ribose-phosphate pyrophosphokinase
MRQDKAFHAGEAVTSITFASLLSAAFDWLLTVDPHLHRFRSLGEVYSIPAMAASAGRPIADWLSANVVGPFLVGPDSESAQWVARIAKAAGAPYSVLAKVRTGDADVVVSDAPAEALRGRVPVVVDDIASSAVTMIETVGRLRDAGHPDPVCVVVHPIFADGAAERLLAAGVAAIVSTNTITHPSNGIDVADVLAAGLEKIS